MKQSSTERRGPISEGPNDLPGLIATIHELQAELQRQRQQVQSVSTLHWEFLRHIGHEIRNPMTAIIGMTDLALLTELTEEQRECLGTVQNAARTLMRVLNNMQDYARLQAGTLELEWSGFRLRGCLRELVGKLAPQARSKGLELLCRVAPEVPDAIVADLRRLVQVLEHLLTNALLYTHRGEVSLEVTVVKDLAKEVTLRFRVRDTGVGMEEATRAAKIWSRPRSTDSRTRSGAGLGLPMVVGLVELFGGEFTMQSQPGKGTDCEFSATLLKQQSPKEIGDESPPRAKLAGRRVLIALANDTGRRWLTGVCQHAGMEVIVSEPGLAAAGACATEASPRPELALVDEALLDPTASPDDRRGQLAALPIPKVLLHWPDAESVRPLLDENDVLATLTKPWFDEDVRAALSHALSKLDARAPGPDADNPAGRQPAHREPQPKNPQSAEENAVIECEPQEAIARLGGDRELYADVVRQFRKDGPAVIQKLRGHLAASDADMLHRTAHSFKGLAAMCGAVAVAAAAAEVEQAGKHEQMAEAEPLLDKLSEAIERAGSELEPYT